MRIAPSEDDSLSAEETTLRPPRRGRTRNGYTENNKKVHYGETENGGMKLRKHTVVNIAWIAGLMTSCSSGSVSKDEGEARSKGAQASREEWNKTTLDDGYSSVLRVVHRSL